MEFHVLIQDLKEIQKKNIKEGKKEYNENIQIEKGNKSPKRKETIKVQREKRNKRAKKKWKN